MKKIKLHIINGKNLKKIVWGVSFCMLMGSITGCNFSSRADYLAKANKSDEEQADETIQSIIDALEAKNTESLKSLFSKYAVENAVNLDEKIEELMTFYPGCSGGIKGNYNTHETANYGVKIEALNGTYTVTNDSVTYTIRFTIQRRNDEEPDKIGLHLIEVMTPEAKPDGFKWKDEEDAPGVYVLE